MASACIFTKSNTPAWVFYTLFKLHKWYQQIAQNSTYYGPGIWKINPSFYFVLFYFTLIYPFINFFVVGFQDRLFFILQTSLYSAGFDLLVPGLYEKVTRMFKTMLFKYVWPKQL